MVRGIRSLVKQPAEERRSLSVKPAWSLVLGPMAARRASDLSAEVGERLLKMRLKDDRRAKQIAVNLTKSFFAHGDAVSRGRAKDLELQVADP